PAAATPVAGAARGSGGASVALADPSNPCAGVAATPTKDKRRRVALLVGVQSYERSDVPDDAAWANLAGPGNDLRLMSRVLAEHGFEVECLFDEDATHDAIVSRFESHLIAKSRKGREDVALFYFSGHGQQIPDDSDRDEVDGFDESLVPFDHRGTHDYAGAARVRDDELRELSRKVLERTPNLVVILDSCHSGSATRGTRPARGQARGILPPLKPVTEPPVLNEREDYGGERGVVLSAAQSNQVAREIVLDGKAYGAFSFVLGAALADAGPETTYTDLLRRTQAKLPAWSLSQSPRLEGDGNRAVFSGALVPTPNTFLVEALKRNRPATVRAGAVHGLHAGDALALFPLDAKKSELRLDVDPPPPTILIEEVGPGTSAARAPEAKVHSELAERFPNGAQALVAAYVARGVQSVALRHAPLLEVLTAAIDGEDKNADPFPNLQVTDDEENADFVIRLLENNEQDKLALGSGDFLAIVRSTGDLVPIPLGQDRPPVLAVPAASSYAMDGVLQGLEGYHAQQRFRRLSETRGRAGGLRGELRLRTRNPKATECFPAAGEPTP
ncbi:MAG: caspase family protein, partial [Myxococcota bacterium]